MVAKFKLMFFKKLEFIIFRLKNFKKIKITLNKKQIIIIRKFNGNKLKENLQNFKLSFIHKSSS